MSKKKQCITCRVFSMRDAPRGKGYCYSSGSSDGKVRDAMEIRECKGWKLGAMDQVFSRSVRNFVFNEAGIARLV